jgi:hypothetical protein
MHIKLSRNKKKSVWLIDIKSVRSIYGMSDPCVTGIL